MERVLALAFLSAGFTDLPLADALHPDPKGPLQASAQLEGIAADLDDVVNECAHGSQRERRGEQHHVAELDKHLLVVLEGVLREAARETEAGDNCTEFDFHCRKKIVNILVNFNKHLQK